MSHPSDPSLPPGDDLDVTLFERHWLGEASAAESARVDAWFEANPGQREWYARLAGNLATSVQARRSPDDLARLTAAILPVAGVPGNIVPGQQAAETFRVAADRIPARKPSRAWRNRPLARRTLPWTAGVGLAAAAVLAAGVGSLALWQADALRTWLGSPASVAVSALDGVEQTYVTPARRRASFTLPDGSRVVLAPGSRLRVPVGFGQRTRDLHLEGEAHFTVAHDVTRPFAVHTAHGIARDIGTIFNIRAYPELRTVEVAVIEGEVALASASHHGKASQAAAPVLLRAADIGYVGADGRLTKVHHADVAARTAWTTGQLVLDGPLTEVLPALARWYDLDIRLANPTFGARQLTITLRDGAVDVALERIALALGLQVQRQGRQVTLSGDRK